MRKAVTFTAISPIMPTTFVKLLYLIKKNSFLKISQVPTCIMVLTDQQKKFFIENGYVLLREAIPKPQVIAARKKADEAYAEKRYKDHDTHKGIVPGFEESLGKTQEIGHMLKNSVLLEACEDLLGKGNVRYGNKAQVAFRPTEHDFREKGMGIKELMPNHRWHVDGGDGKYRETGTPFTLLVGVVLSPGQMCDENRGQLHVWPGMQV